MPESFKRGCGSQSKTECKHHERLTDNQHIHHCRALESRINRVFSIECHEEKQYEHNQTFRKSTPSMTAYGKYCAKGNTYPLISVLFAMKKSVGAKLNGTLQARTSAKGIPHIPFVLTSILLPVFWLLNSPALRKDCTNWPSPQCFTFMGPFGAAIKAGIVFRSKSHNKKGKVTSYFNAASYLVGTDAMDDVVAELDADIMHSTKLSKEQTGKYDLSLCYRDPRCDRAYDEYVLNGFFWRSIRIPLP